MKKAELAVLEKLYAAEIDAALSGEPLRGIVQSRSKVYTKLEAEGLIRKAKVTVKSWPAPVTVEGWELTLLGNATYCFSCDGDKSA